MPVRLPGAAGRSQDSAERRHRVRTVGVEEELLPVDPVTGEPRALSAAVLARVRPWLPVLTALSANSPFWQGRDSSYSSCRSRVRRR